MLNAVCVQSANSGVMHEAKRVAIRSRFDHVISAGENRRWNRYTNRLGGLEVDKKLKFRGLLNRKIGGACPFEDLVDERTCAAVQGRHVWAIGCKHTGFPLPLLASKGNGRQSLF